METSTSAEFCLYAWGANSYGQLGFGHVEDVSKPMICDTASLPREAVRVIVGGGGHTAVVTANGELMVCGQNDRGQLGLDHTANISTLLPCRGVNQRVANVSCGWDFTLLLTDCGQVLACGSNVFGQLGVVQPMTRSTVFLPVETLTDSVVCVAAGLRHSLAVTNTGCVYQWGTGLSSHAKRSLSPRSVPKHLGSTLPSLVPGLDGVTAVTVAAGSAHCVCLTDGGDLFLWGSNKHGQLTCDEPFLPSPALLKRTLLGGERATHVWSGWTHLVTRTESGRVFTWGRGNYGQLGWPEPACHNPGWPSGGSMAKGDSTGANLPAEVKLLHGATQIACGSEHNLAILGDSLFSWGWNEHGMCGNGSQRDVHQPQCIFGLRPLLIGCGAGHSMALFAVETGLTGFSTMD